MDLKKRLSNNETPNQTGGAGVRYRALFLRKLGRGGTNLPGKLALKN